MLLSKGKKTYYFFQKDGTAYTAGYKKFKSKGKNVIYYFQKNGQAFTGGYRSVKLGKKTYGFFFQKSGQAFTKGLKSIKGKKKTYLYYFTKSGKAKKNSFAKVKGKTYYFGAQGKAVKGFYTIKKKKYYFNDKGVLQKGWIRRNDGYYYANEKNGALAVNQVIGGYKLDSNGRTQTRTEILKIVNSCTNASMSKDQKIQSLWNWLMGNSWGYIRTFEHISPSWSWYEGWADDFAISLIRQHGGNCYRYAALFGFLVKEATGYSVRVHCGMTPGRSAPTVPHSWLTVNQEGVWYAYDPDLYKFNTPRSAYYRTPYSERNQEPEKHYDRKRRKQCLKSTKIT